LTAKSPVVAKFILRFEPDAGVIPTAPELIIDGVVICVVNTGEASGA
jgi:hypothetical protein